MSGIGDAVLLKPAFALGVVISYHETIPAESPLSAIRESDSN